MASKKKKGPQKKKVEAKNWRLRIRMYRQGLGDCFLLTFNSPKGLRHMLIDCGVFQGTPGGKKKIINVAENIAKETNKHLDILVVTHEHWDHNSGFYDAKDTFKDITVGQIWVSWTEDPGQKIVKEKKKLAAIQLASLQLALAKLADGSAEEQDRGSALAETLSFFGGISNGQGLAAFAKRTDEAMNAVTQREPKPRYCNPGDFMEPDSVPGIRFYVLAPPKDPDQFSILTGKVGAEMYGLAAANCMFSALTALEPQIIKNAALPDNFQVNVEEFLPFDRHLQWTDINHLRNQWDLFNQYADPEEAWRRIDNDWLYSAAGLALQLDSYTNNTTLVLAIELVETGEVFLFVGDAQIGNWESWKDLEWKIQEKDGKEATVKTSDLLKRTVFYKVGHHGSHNATLKEGGLESMTSSNLVAAIPVDEEFARLPKGSKKDGWDMPAGPLLGALIKKTKGRVIRADWKFPPDPTTPPPGGLDAKEWKSFVQSIRFALDELYIDYYA
jgi:hypothetical protein